MIHMVRAYRVSGGRELPVLSDGVKVVAGSTAIVEHSRRDNRNLRSSRPIRSGPPPHDYGRNGRTACWPPTHAACWWRARYGVRGRASGSSSRQRLAASAWPSVPFGDRSALSAAVFRAASPAAVRASRVRVAAAFDLLDVTLAEHPYLVGDSLTLADLSVAVAANTAFVSAEERESHLARRLLEWVRLTLPAPYQRWQ